MTASSDPPAVDALARLLGLVARLRATDGCPWDRVQTHESLRAALIEECYEVVDAIAAGDSENLAEELGDLLLHVTLHSRIAEEAGQFDFAAVCHGLCEKLVRRHPHVFGDESAANSEEVVGVWERAKAREKPARLSQMDGIPNSLPSILRAEKAGRKAARVGFDWGRPEDVLSKIREEIAEVEAAMGDGNQTAIAEEIGDLLFSVVNLARKQRMEAELLLHEATDKFVGRFRRMEAALAAGGRRIEREPPGALEAAWQEAKAAVQSTKSAG